MTQLLRASVLGYVFLVASACPSSGQSEAKKHEDCAKLRPFNPYLEGSGHYAGFEWAESNGSSVCGGNSTSFIEGCEEFQQELAAYRACVAKK